MRTSSGGGDGVGGGGIHHHPWASGSAPCSASHSIVVEMTSFVINDAMTAVHVRSTTKTKGFNIAIVDECWLAVDNTIKVNRTNNFHFDPGGWLANSVLAGSFMRLFGRSSSLARVAVRWLLGFVVIVFTCTGCCCIANQPTNQHNTRIRNTTIIMCTYYIVIKDNNHVQCVYSYTEQGSQCLVTAIRQVISHVSPFNVISHFTFLFK